MTDIAIRVENLGKMYRIGGKQQRYDRLSERVMDTLAAPIRRLKSIGQPPPPEETIWALKEVSFEIKRGEVVGVIGRNGAGKSTLLKILSRITEPTTGRVELHGRVASLLEVGTGFHPELTGRENIYLNGAILGMKRAEIDRKFDEIVAFAEIDKFIDTPVKRYSSGMYVRLAFAVAAHLEPEILLVDEVLAVGDAQFQKKCLGKMGEVAKEGRTVLFVSHNMGAVRSLCRQGLVLDAGRLQCSEMIAKAIEDYATFSGALSPEKMHRPWPNLSQQMLVTHVHAKLPQAYGDTFTLFIDYKTIKPTKYFACGWFLNDAYGTRVLYGLSSVNGDAFLCPKAIGRVTCTVENWLLRGGTYSVSVFLWIPNIQCFDFVENATTFQLPEMATVSGFILNPSFGYGLANTQWQEDEYV